MERDFKGVWIPKEIWLDDRLNALDKIIFVEIDSLCSEERGCFASNKYLAEFCQCSETKISKAISKLIDLEYLYVVSFNGRQRELQSCLAKNAKLPCKKCKAEKQKMQGSIYIDNNNKDNNKDNKEVSKKEQGKNSKKTTLEKTQCAQKPHTGFEAPQASVSKSDTVENGHTNALSTVNENALSTVSKKVSKKEQGENSKKTADQTFDELIESYTDNEELKNELKEHLKTRKAKKGALTNHAIELSLKTLDKLANTDKEKILIVQKSIENGWTSFFPLSSRQQKENKKSNYNIEEYENYSIFDSVKLNPNTA